MYKGITMHTHTHARKYICVTNLLYNRINRLYSYNIIYVELNLIRWINFRYMWFWWLISWRVSVGGGGGDVPRWLFNWVCDILCPLCDRYRIVIIEIILRICMQFNWNFSTQKAKNHAWILYIQLFGQSQQTRTHAYASTYGRQIWWICIVAIAPNGQTLRQAFGSVVFISK